MNRLAAHRDRWLRSGPDIHKALQTHPIRFASACRFCPRTRHLSMPLHPLRRALLEERPALLHSRSSETSILSEDEREGAGAEADTSWKFEDLWQSPHRGRQPRVELRVSLHGIPS